MRLVIDAPALDGEKTVERAPAEQGAHVEARHHDPADARGVGGQENAAVPAGDEDLANTAGEGEGRGEHFAQIGVGFNRVGPDELERGGRRSGAGVQLHVARALDDVDLDQARGGGGTFDGVRHPGRDEVVESEGGERDHRGGNERDHHEREACF